MGLDDGGNSKIVDREMDEVEMEIEKKKNEKLAKKGIIRRSKEEKRKARREKEKLRKRRQISIKILVIFMIMYRSVKRSMLPLHLNSKILQNPLLQNQPERPEAGF